MWEKIVYFVLSWFILLTKYSDYQIEEMGMTHNIWREEKCIQGLGAETWRKELFLTPIQGWEDNVKVDLKRTGGYGPDSSGLG